VRGPRRPFIFAIDEKKDKAPVVYSKTANPAVNTGAVEDPLSGNSQKLKVCFS